MEIIMNNQEILKFYLYSGNVQYIHFLLILMVIDIVTGLIKAFVNKNLWSRKSTYGYARKIMIFLIIILANAIDQLAHLNGALVLATILFYIVNECLSILENTVQLGLPVPPQIKEVLAVLQEKKTSIVTEVTEGIETTKNVTDSNTAEIKIKVEKETK